MESRLIAWVVIALTGLVFLLSTCANTVEIRPESSAQKRIVLLAKSRNGDFWNTLKMGAEAAAKEFNISLVFDGPSSEDDVRGQRKLMRNYLANGMDALVVAPSDYELLVPDVNAVIREGVPVVSVDSDVNSREISSYIGIDNYDAGRKAASKLQELSGNKAHHFIILSSSVGGRSEGQRVAGIKDEFAAAADKVVANLYDCESDVLKCAQRTRSLLKSGERVDGILALNAAASVGAASALQELGLNGSVKLVAFENSIEELEWLQEGVVQATLIQNPFYMGYLSVKTALAAANHQKVKARIVTETRVIDSESMFWSDNQKILFPFVK